MKATALRLVSLHLDLLSPTGSGDRPPLARKQQDRRSNLREIHKPGQSEFRVGFSYCISYRLRPGRLARSNYSSWSRLPKEGAGPEVVQNKPMKFSDSARRNLGVSALLLSILQAVCPAFLALGAVRLWVGFGALALAASTRAALRSYHQDAIRIPVMIIALVAASLNLFVIWQIRRLRARPAAQWRVTAPTPKQLRSERAQIILALLTYFFLVVESLTHLKLHHHL